MAQADFESLLRTSNMENIIDDSGATYGLWPDLSLAYVNQAWYRFARRNGAKADFSARWAPGACLLDALPTVLSPYYQNAYLKCLQSHRPWEHHYECSSTDHYRRFYQTVYPLPEAQGLLVINRPLVVLPHSSAKRPPKRPDLSIYQDTQGVLHQCAHCRRTQNHSQEGWDWVPDWIEDMPPQTQYSLCPVCTNFYYPGHC